MVTPSLEQTVTAESERNVTRAAILAGIVGALLQMAGGIVETVDRVEHGEPGFAWRTSVIGIAYLLLLGTLVAVARSGVGGRAARLGFAMTAGGWVMSAVAQFVLQVNFDLAEQVLFPVATMLIGIGMMVAGIPLFRAWIGWRRVTALACGVYPFAVLFPWFAAAGGPNFLVLSGWGACWLALALALWTRAEAPTAIGREAGHTSGLHA
jgi:hypothetical protein